MKSARSHHRIHLCDVQRHPQLPAVCVLRAAADTVVPALLHAHRGLAHGQTTSTTEVAADDVVRLAERLRDAVDNYCQVMTEADATF